MSASDGNGETHAIFRSLSVDGTCWLFMTLPRIGWVITRDGEQVAAGMSNRASIRSGVQKYLALAAIGKQRPRAAGKRQRKAVLSA